MAILINFIKSIQLSAAVNSTNHCIKAVRLCCYQLLKKFDDLTKVNFIAPLRLLIKNHLRVTTSFINIIMVLFA